MLLRDIFDLIKLLRKHKLHLRRLRLKHLEFFTEFRRSVAGWLEYLVTINCEKSNIGMFERRRFMIR
jgi:hypothetical protein